MYLFLNTADQTEMSVALVGKQGEILSLKKVEAEYQQSEKLLPVIELLMANSKWQMANLRGVIVVAGPGGFTSLRIGLATANVLAWACQVPVVGVKNSKRDMTQLIQDGLKKIKKVNKFKVVLPFYGQEPNITFRKGK